jgi:outer membrane protein OmpA-like peptidoglycan-associated protein
MTSTTVAPDLISAIQRQIKPETVGAIASQLGEDRERTAAAVSAGIPSVLAALSDVVRSETGADYLKEIIDERREQATPAAEGGQVLLDATAGNDHVHEATLLDDELGQRSWTISDAVAQSSGIRRESAHRLLGGVASVAVNTVAESAGNLSAGGLRSFLNAQRRDWMNRLPRSIVSAFETPPGALTSAPAPHGAEEPPVFAPPSLHRTWILPVLLALAVLLFVPLIRGARRNSQRRDMGASGAASPVATSARPNALPPPAPPVAARIPPAAEPNPAANLRAVPARAETPAMRDEMVSALAVFLSAPPTEARTPQRFTLPSLGFEAGGVEPSSAGSETINQISAMLQAHPSAVVRLESFTDNVGRSEDNHDLSRRRSEAVKALLVEDGADATRIEVGGLGQQHPIANNATAEGRQQNQRTDLVVTQR